MDSDRRERLENRFQAINNKLEALRESGVSPVPGVDAEFYREQLLIELDEIEYELGKEDFK